LHASAKCTNVHFALNCLKSYRAFWIWSDPKCSVTLQTNAQNVHVQFAQYKIVSILHMHFLVHFALCAKCTAHMCKPIWRFGRKLALIFDQKVRANSWEFYGIPRRLSSRKTSKFFENFREFLFLKFALYSANFENFEKNFRKFFENFSRNSKNFCAQSAFALCANLICCAQKLN